MKHDQHLDSIIKKYSSQLVFNYKGVMRFYLRWYIILPLNDSGLQKALGIILMKKAISPTYCAANVAELVPGIRYSTILVKVKSL